MKLNRNTLRCRLEELADEAEQKRLWLGGSTDEMSSFSEAQCGVFNDSGLGRMLDKGVVASEFGPDVAKLALELRSLCKMIPTNVPETEVIDDEVMLLIRVVANQLLHTSIVQPED